MAWAGLLLASGRPALVAFGVIIALVAVFAIVGYLG